MSKAFTDAVQAGVFITPLKTRLGLFDPEGNEVTGTIQIGTDFSSASNHMDRVAHHVTGLLREISPLANLNAVAVAVAGEVDKKREKIDNASRLYRWVGFNIADHLTKMLDAPVILGNDAEARTRWLAMNDRRLVYSTFDAFFWGEGLGGTRAILQANGHSFENFEPGHIKVKGLKDHEKLACLCGGKGCLDAHAGGARIAHVKATAGRKWLTDEEWQSFTDPVVRMLVEELRWKRPDKLVLGGQRLNNHRELKAFLMEGLQRQMPNHPQVIFTDLEFAPAHTALSLLPEMAGSLR